MSLLNPSVILGILAAMAAAFIAGCDYQDTRHQAQLLEHERAHHAAFVQRATQLRNNAIDVGAALNQAWEINQRDRRAFNDRLTEASNAGQLGKCEPVVGQPGAAPVVVVNAGLWNGALEIGRGPGGDPARADAPAGGADFAPLDRAYANLGENAALWKACRDQVIGWQELARKNGWVKP